MSCAITAPSVTPLVLGLSRWAVGGVLSSSLAGWWELCEWGCTQKQQDCSQDHLNQTHAKDWEWFYWFLHRVEMLGPYWLPAPLYRTFISMTLLSAYAHKIQMRNILTHNYIAKYNMITIILSPGLPHSIALEVEFLQIRMVLKLFCTDRLSLVFLHSVNS